MAGLVSGKTDDVILNDIVTRALEEDLGSGDVTTNSLFGPSEECTGTIFAKEEGIVAGLPAAHAVFRKLQPAIVWKESLNDGAHVKPGEVLAQVHGACRTVLTGERVALNLLQRLSGIATTTARYVEAVRGLRVTILDTRKTTAGLRMLEKYAVRMGGGTNHRRGLFDAVLIKNNHIKLSGSIAEAVGRIRRTAPPDLPIEVETASLDEVQQALRAGAHRIMLDNMPLDMMREAVKMVNRKVPLEASGTVTLERVRAIAETGVDFISVGALTHSYRSLDIALHIDDGGRGKDLP